jgi:hypothetical protein
MGNPVDDDGYWRIGPHRIKFEPPDIIHIVTHGDVDAAHVAAMFDVVNDAFRLPTPYILRDARGGGAPTRAARAFVTKDSRVQRLAGIVSYGASFHVGIASAMVDKALRVLRPDSPRILFFDTCDEARAWIEADRMGRAKRD